MCTDVWSYYAHLLCHFAINGDLCTCLLSVLQPVNTFVITARECSRALTDIRNREHPGMGSQLKGKLDEWRVEYRVTLLRVASWWALKWVSTVFLALLLKTACC